MNKNKNGLLIIVIMISILIGAGLAGVIAMNIQKKEAAPVDPYFDGAIYAINGKTSEGEDTSKGEKADRDGGSGTIIINPDRDDTDDTYADAEGDVLDGEGGNGEYHYFGPDSGYSGGNSSGGSGGNGNIITPPALPAISFPYTVSGTDIVVEQISSYNGYYIEDGQDQAVSNVAAIVVTNKGSDLEFLGIGIAQVGISLTFSGSQIPSGATVIILEQNKAAYNGAACYSCTATVNRIEKFSMEEGRIKIEQEVDGTFTVYNISEETLPSVRVQFKKYLPGEDIYVGGITYTVTIPDLEPDMGTNVSPESL